MSFCHLHLHSQYSILESSLALEDIARRAKECAMSAVALTDHGNLYGAVEFYKALRKVDCKPIIGCEFSVATTSRFDKQKSSSNYHVVLLAKNEQGYKSLCKLSSAAFIEGFYYVPRIDFEILSKYAEGLICLSGCVRGVFAESIIDGNDQELAKRIEVYQKLFGEDLYFEIQRHHMSQDDLQLDGMVVESWLYQKYQTFVEHQQKVEQRLLLESQKRSIPCVATNNVHYLNREDWRAHEILLNVQSGETCWIRDQQIIPNPKRSTFPSHEYDFKSPAEMEKRFKDIPEALALTEEIADKCNVEFDFTTKHYPVFNCDKEPGQYLKDLCDQGMSERYTENVLQKVGEQYPDKDPMQVVRDRLNFELDIIFSKGLADYFLLVWDFIHWAKEKGIPVGPGRGSVVGSIIAYLIGITDIEPLRFNLLFERFINPGRMSYPDIDVDLCMDRRSEVIEYTTQKYGRENVAQIITFGTMKAKMSVRDVGRVLNIPLSKVNHIAKLIPDELNITLTQALEREPELRALVERDEEVASIMQAARVLEGSIRSTGIHAAGLIVSGEPLTDYIPICTAKDSEMYATQYSMKPAEQVGMLKIDFLGLKTLTMLQLCSESVHRSHGVDIDWRRLPLDDSKTFELFSEGKTLGVFQIEDGGMQELAKQLRMDRFEEIIALGALYRPGPMEMIPTYIARKLGREAIEYDHPMVENILKETYGVMVYQEQIMQIAGSLANYTLGEGDVLRRAMGKKDAKEMARQREKFVGGAVQNGIEENVATSIFDRMEKFCEYGFNKSHSTAYGYLTYATAYFKAHYPADWLAALMTGDKDDIEKVSKLMHEAKQLGIACLPPDINESDVNFVATNQGIRFALSAIKGVGAQAVQALVDERKNGSYMCLYDFVYRMDHKRIGKRMIEFLIDAGSFDQFGWSRDELTASLQVMYDDVQKIKRERACGVLDLFDENNDSVPERYQRPVEPATKRSDEEFLFREKELLGMFFGGHPLTKYQDVLRSLHTLSIREVEALPDSTVFRMGFVVESVEIKTSSRSSKRFAILTISDYEGNSIEMPVWPDLFEANQEILRVNALLWGVFSKEKRNGSDQLSCRWLAELNNTTQSVVEASYEAYERAKKQLSYEKRPRKTESKKQIKEQSFIVYCDILEFKASHVVQLAQEFAQAEGTDRVCIALHEHGQEVARLQVPQICFSKSAQKCIESLPCWQKTIKQ